MIRRALILLYLAVMALLATGIGVVGEAVSEYGVTIEEKQSQTKQRVHQIITNRQERIEQERQQAAESAQIAHRWRARAVQLARFIERRGLSVPAPTVPLRDVPSEGTPPPNEPPGPSPDVPVPSLESSPSEPPPFQPPPDVLPTVEPNVTCVDLPSPDPDFCIELPPTPNPNP